MKITPLKKNIIIGPKKEETSKGGIVIPSTVVDQRGYSVVLAVSKEITSIKPKDIVVRDVKFPGRMMPWFDNAGNKTDAFMLDIDGLMGVVIK